MATIVPNTSLQSLNEALYRLSLLNEEKKKREFEQAKYLNSIKKNQEAEQLFAQSQRGLLGNLFADKTPEREFTSAFADLNPADKPLLDVPQLDAGQEIIAELKAHYGDDIAGYNKNMQQLGKLTDSQKVYEAASNAYRNQYGSDLSDADIREQYNQDFFRNGKMIGRDNLPEYIRNAYKVERSGIDRLTDSILRDEQAVQRQAQIQAQNEAIARANANKPYQETLTGNEMDRVNTETDNAYRAIQNAKTYNEKLKQYGKYLNSVTSLRKSFQGDFKPLKPEDMGIFIPAKGGGTKAAPKGELMSFHNKKNELIGVWEVPRDILQSETPRANVYKRYKDQLEEMGVTNFKDFSYVPASKENTDLEGRRVKAEAARFDQDLLEDTVRDANLKKNASRLKTFKAMWDNKTLNEDYARRVAHNYDLDNSGDTWSKRVHPTTGEWMDYDDYLTLIKGSRNSPSKTQNNPANNPAVERWLE